MAGIPSFVDRKEYTAALFKNKDNVEGIRLFHQKRRLSRGIFLQREEETCTLKEKKGEFRP